jgi:hypothetical protein
MEPTSSTATCPVCNQPVLLQYHFCPNCGTKLSAVPLSTSFDSQFQLYFFSIILPMICFLFITRWKGWKYFKSPDEKTQTIGLIACGLLIVSTIFTIYVATVWTRDVINSSTASINSQMNQDFSF